MVAGNGESLVQIQAMGRVPVVAGIERDNAITSLFCLLGDIVEQGAAVSFSARFRQGHQVIDIKVFATEQKLQVPVSDGRHGFTIFFDKCELVTFF